MDFKKKITLSLALLLCTSAFVRASENGINQIPENFQQVVDEVNDATYLEKLSFEIKNFIDDVEQVINKLKDEKDTTSFAQCTALVDAKLEFMLKAFITPLKDRLAQHKDPSSMHYKALKAADNVIAILYAQFQKLAKVMKDPANRQAGLKMATALKNQVDMFFNQHAALDKEIAELHTCLAILQFDALVKEIAMVRSILQEAKENNAKPMPKDQQAKFANMIHKKLKR